MKKLGINTTSYEVVFLQDILKRLGLLNSNVDGIFGNNTKNAVISFQKSKNIPGTGIVNSETWDLLIPYSFVPTNIPYTSDILYYNMEMFKMKYDFLEFGDIGLSVMEKPIQYIKIGSGPNEVIYVRFLARQ